MSRDLTPWLTRAKADARQKLREVAGAKSNPIILDDIIKVYDPTAKDDSKVAWCGYYIAFCFREEGLERFIVDKPGWADNWRKLAVKFSEPVKGAITVMPRYDSAGKLIGNHVTIVDSWDADYIYCYGGNQDNEVNKSAYSRKGKRKPKGYWMPYPLDDPPELAPGKQSPSKVKPPSPAPTVTAATPPPTPAQPTTLEKADDHDGGRKVPIDDGDTGRTPTVNDMKLILGATTAGIGVTKAGVETYNAITTPAVAQPVQQIDLSALKTAAEGAGLVQQMSGTGAEIFKVFAAFPWLLAIALGGALTYVLVFRKR